ncbi:MAG: RnfABCDGE type electron transport complex subunit A [Treponema sp.]|uniref:electron transport complex protein RnfA n=1 Tax=Treponema sp. TaxID=166 RepID=UPI001D86AFA9|nr:RnfABCDGE type electron transport complex subunit A [Treponema sp.]MBS7310240.1 RnfABCDGE type electron transport complex subunit A [Treponema sp.]MCI5696160.1 RnfABCDGE type electron transport complex subunit A [Spirochaetia bacterium]MDD5810639.1 RnfABCDGE type electron transport complex subunit A [Treponema sp.]MDY5885948.1 RnfABCDGE type electron transport complex subunit A [Treponema sp.]
MNSLLKIFLAAVLVDNVVFVQYLALCPFMGMTSSTDKSFGMGMATTFVIMLATIVTFPIYHFILVPLKLEFLQTLIFILVIASLVQLVEFYLKKSAPGLYSSMGVYLALITTNCAVLAITLNCIAKNYTYLESIVYAFGASCGFILSMVIMSGVRERMRSSNVPLFMKGKAILYIIASLLSLSFMGFKGLIK